LVMVMKFIAATVAMLVQGSARTLPCTTFREDTMNKRRETGAYAGYPWHEAHQEELKTYAREYRVNNPEYNERRAKKAKEDRLADPEFFKAREFAREMKKYGTTVEWYTEKLTEQSGLCALCAHLSHHHGTIQRLQVDHNHDCCDLRTRSCGKCLRGLLCADCNILLSYLERLLKQSRTLVPAWDTWLENAILYLTRYGSPTQENQ
jgi:hypothetical protein